MKSVLSIMLGCLLLLLSCVNKKAKLVLDEFDEKINKLVLSERRVDEEFFFKAPFEKGILEYKVKYLGRIKTLNGDSLYFITNIVFTGLYEDSKRASCTLNIYDDNSNKIGYYYVGGAKDASQKIEGSRLVFKSNSDGCNQSTDINFKDSIPKQIFIKCTTEEGDLYTFENIDNK